MELLPLSLPIDFRFEEALGYFPARGAAPDEVMVFGESVARVDAWGGVALKATIEYYARYQQRRVTLSPPLDEETWKLLYSLVHHDPPAQVVLPQDASAPPDESRAVLLPAVRLPTVNHADDAAEALIDTSGGRTGRGLRFIAGVLPELIDNSLRWGLKSPIAPIGCVLHDRQEDELQLVVADLDDRLARQDDPAESLARAVASVPEGALTSLAASAEARGLDSTLTLAAGTGRLYRRQGKWSKANGDESVPGFVAVVTIPLD